MFFGQENDTFDNGIVYKTSFTLASIAVPDLNIDNWLNIIVSTGFKDYLNIFLNYDNEIFTKKIHFGNGSYTKLAGVNDFNGSGRTDTNELTQGQQRYSKYF